MDNVHVTLWQQDERSAAGIPSDSGLSASASWVFNNKWVPFLGGGWADGGAALCTASASAGVGYVMRRQDIIGLGANWDRPGGDQNLGDQWIVELFYKY